MNTRLFWIIWCCAWALFWMLAGFFTFLLAWILVPVSLIAILLPVGRAPRAIQPPPGPGTHDPRGVPSSAWDTRFTPAERDAWAAEQERQRGQS